MDISRRILATERPKADGVSNSLDPRRKQTAQHLSSLYQQGAALILRRQPCQPLSLCDYSATSSDYYQVLRANSFLWAIFWPYTKGPTSSLKIENAIRYI